MRQGKSNYSVRQTQHRNWTNEDETSQAYTNSVKGGEIAHCAVIKVRTHVILEDIFLTSHAYTNSVKGGEITKFAVVIVRTYVILEDTYTTYESNQSGPKNFNRSFE